jgi:hypothetical protein
MSSNSLWAITRDVNYSADALIDDLTLVIG